MPLTPPHSPPGVNESPVSSECILALCVYTVRFEVGEPFRALKIICPDCVLVGVQNDVQITFK